jgi:hypothetical protein
MQRQYLPDPAKGDPPVAWRRHLQVHPAADFFPCMKDVDPEAFNALVRDIDTNGLHTPVVLFEENGKEKLLDGRNRLDALARLGRVNFVQGRLHIERDIDDGGCFDPVICRHARSDQVSTGCDPYAFALSLNVHRRHLTAEQKNDLIAAVLKAKPELTDRQIARMTKSSPTTVGKKRGESEAANVQGGHKERKEASGRKARGRKPGQPAKKAAKVETKVQPPIEVEDPTISAEAMKQAHAAAEVQTDNQADDQDHGDRAHDEGHRAGQASPADPLISAFWNTSKEGRLIFAEYVRGLKGQAQLSKALTAAGDPNKTLNPVQIGRYLELIGPDRFLEAVHHAPKLLAEVERRLAEKALATTEYAQSKLIKNGASANGTAP